MRGERVLVFLPVSPVFPCARARLYGMTYSTLIAGLARSNVVLDRKILSELAMFEPFSFRAVTLAAEASGVQSKQLKSPRVIVPKRVVERAQ